MPGLAWTTIQMKKEKIQRKDGHVKTAKKIMQLHAKKWQEERERERERRERERERTFSALTVLNTGKEAVQRGCCAGGNIYNESSRKKYDFDIQRWRCNKLVTSFQSLPGILQIERWCGYQGSRQQAPSGGNMKNAP
jgi:hypothetical protein